MKERFSNLLTIKSLVTLAMTIVFCILALRGVLTGQEFLTVFTTVIAFYFGTQAQKRADEAVAKVQTGVVVDTVAETPVQKPSAVDGATYEQMHPSENEEDIVVSGFAG